MRVVADRARVTRREPHAVIRASVLWWRLAACAERAGAPLDVILSARSEGSVLRHALVDKDAGLLLARLGTLPPGPVGEWLECQLDDRAWQDLLSLIHAGRAPWRNAAIDDRAVWSGA